MTEIRRQSETHDPHGVIGPPDLRNQVREVHLRIEAVRSDDGATAFRLSTPQARGWAVVARTREQLARAVGEAFLEAQVAAYARWRGQAYDLDALTDVDETHPLTASATVLSFGWDGPARDRRADVHSAEAWTPLPDGRWRSPTGRCYREDTEVVRRVQAKRRRAGIPQDPDL